MKAIWTAVASAAFAAIASSASAATILFDFEDLGNNGDKIYASQGYVFDPINFNNAGSCADDGGSTCFLETSNGDPTTLVHGVINNNGTQNKNDDFADSDGAEFDMLGFYFDFQGGGPNTLELYGPSGSPFTSIALSTAYDGTGPFSIYSTGGSLVTTALQQQTGYFAIFNRDYFDNISSFSWEAAENKQIRVDCVIISDTNDNIGIDAFSSCGVPPTTPVPVPAAGFLLLGGLGGLVVLRRRKA